MSSNLWLYSPARCDGDFCPKDCDHCEKGKEQDDLISRAAAIDVASGYCHPANIAQELAKLPSAKPEIIRCKDCKWFGRIGCAISIVDDSDRPTENDFCSFAERRTDDKI